MKISSIIFTILLLAVVGFYFLGSNESSKGEIKTTKAVTKLVERTVVERGFIDASEKSLLQANVGGTLIDVVDNGKYTKKGDVLYELDNTHLKYDIERNKTNLERDRLNLEGMLEYLESVKTRSKASITERQEVLRNTQVREKYELSKPLPDDLRRLEISLELAIIAEEEAKLELERQTRLFKKGFLSQVALDPYERSYITKQERTKDAKLNISIAKKGVTKDVRVKLAQEVLRAKANLERVEERTKREALAQEGWIKSIQKSIAKSEYELSKIVKDSGQSIHYANRDGVVQIRRYYSHQRGKIISYSPGTHVYERSAVLKIINPNKMFVNVIFNEADFHSLQVGQKVEMSLPAFSGEIITGHLSSLGALGRDRNEWLTEMSGNSDVSMYNGVITLDKQLAKLQYGMSVICKVALEDKYQALTIPRSAVVYKDEKYWVFTNGSKKEIKGRNVNDFDFEVISGLSEGESINTIYPGDQL